MCLVKNCLSIEAPFCSAHITDWWTCKHCDVEINVEMSVPFLGQLFCSGLCRNEWEHDMRDTGREDMDKEADDGFQD